MTQVNLCDWEQNGYHDSYFFAAVYDTDTNEIKGVQTGSTAYAGGVSIPSTDDESVILKAYIAFENQLRVSLFNKACDIHDSPEPENISPGDKVVSTSRFRCKERIKIACEKCKGSGHWVNPKRESDKRECFACNGVGYNLKNKTNDDGKGLWLSLKEGTEIIVDEISFYGRFYDNGYKQKDRESARITGHLEDGTVVSIAMNKTRLGGDKPVEENFRRIAHSIACKGSFDEATGIKCAWLSNHYAPCPEEFVSMEPQEC